MNENQLPLGLLLMGLIPILSVLATMLLLHSLDGLAKSRGRKSQERLRSRAGNKWEKD